MGFQQIGTTFEVVEIVLQCRLSLLVLPVKIETLSIGKSQGVLLCDLHLTAVGVDIAEILIQIVLLHVDASDDVHGLARLVRVGIRGYQILQVCQGLVILVVVVIDHANFHHRLTRIARTRTILDEAVEIGNGRSLVAMNEIGVADFEKRLLVIWRAGIGLNHVVQHVDLLVHIAFGTIAKTLLIQCIVGIAFPHAGGKVVIVDGLVVAAIHEETVTEANVSIGLELTLGLIGKADKALEALGGGTIIGFLVVDVTQVVVGEGIFRQSRSSAHALELGEVFACFVVVAHLIGRLTHPETGLSLVGDILLAVHDL